MCIHLILLGIPIGIMGSKILKRTVFVSSPWMTQALSNSGIVFVEKQAATLPTGT
jgi:hypothetical protein